jgi:integrase
MLFAGIFRTQRAAAPDLANANPHRLRHTFGTDMARIGCACPSCENAGHAFPETTLQYVNLSMADVAAEFHRAMKALEIRHEQDAGADVEREP